MSAILEMVGIGLLVPFLGFLSSPEKILGSKYIQYCINFFGINDSSQILYCMAGAFILTIMMASGMRIFMLKYQLKLTSGIGADLTREMFRRTLYQPYVTHVNRNSSDIISTIGAKADSVVSNVLMPTLTLLNAAVVIFTLAIIFLIADAVATLVAIFSLSLIYGSVIFLTKERLRIEGNKVTLLSIEVMRIMQESLGGIRDILLDGSQSVHVKALQSVDLPLRRANANLQFLGIVPRYAIEALGIVLVVLVATFLATSGDNFLDVIPFLGLVVLGVQRILPILQQAYWSWSCIRGSKESLARVINLLSQRMPLYEFSEHKTSLHIPFKNEINFNNVSFKYDKDGKNILKPFNLSLKQGRVIGIVGSTGGGKSTFLDLLMGLLLPSEGQISVDGVIMGEEGFRGWSSNISHVPQNIFLTDGTLVENIAFGNLGKSIELDRIYDVCDKSQLLDVCKELPLGINAKVGERGLRLSGGQRQRVGIARALYKNADVMIMDEATSALDSKTEDSVMKSICALRGSKTIIIVTHRTAILKYCDDIIRIESGVIEKSTSL